MGVGVRGVDPRWSRAAGPARGQALIIGVALLAIAMGALFFAVHAGQSVVLKRRVTHVADAAAYSAAAWRARVLNFQAYANRAIVFQEVAVAQAVTLASWSRYFETFTRTAADFGRAYPPVGAVLEVVADIAEALREVTHYAADAEIAWRASPDVGYKSLLQASQELLLASAGGFGASAVANEVARATDARFFAFVLPDRGAFSSLTRRYDSDDDRGRIRDLVDRSLDPFTRGPRGVDFVVWGLPAGCALSSASPADWFQMYRKRGATTLAPGLDRWEAADVGSIHDNVRTGFFRSRCSRVETVPLGWGAREAGLEEPARELLARAGDVETDPQALERAQADLSEQEHQFQSRFSGIERVRDLDYGNLANDRYPTTRTAVLASARPSAVALLDGRPDRLRPGHAIAAGRMWALAVAEAYFARPPGAPERVEFASLYNPYWQARLTAPEAAERALAETYVR